MTREEEHKRTDRQTVALTLNPKRERRRVGERVLWGVGMIEVRTHCARGWGVPGW